MKSAFAFCATLLILLLFRGQALAAVFPNGLSGTASATQSSIVSGVYPGDDAGSCCWMGSRAVLRLHEPASADRVVIEIFQPEYSLRNSRVQTVTAIVAGGKPQQRCCFGVGASDVTFYSPMSDRDRDVTVELQMGHTFVPAEVGKGSDRRRLSALLRSVTYENSTTGEVLAPATPLSAFQRLGATLALLLAGAVLFILTLKRPSYGAAALILADPFSFGYAAYGTTVTLPKVALLAVVIAAVVHRGPYRAGAALRWLLAAQIVLVLSMIASSAGTAVPHAAIRETLKGVQFALTLAIAYHLYRSDPNETLVRGTIAVATALVSVLAFGDLIRGTTQDLVWHGHILPRLAGPLEGPNQLAGYLGVMLPTMLAFMLYRKRLTGEIIAFAIGSIAALLTFSRGGVAAIVLGCAFLLFVRYRPRALRASTIACGGGFVVLLGVTLAAMSGALRGADVVFGSPTALNGGIGTRSLLWHIAGTIWRAHPILGVGPGNFELKSFTMSGVRTHANSIYINTLAEQGLAGLAALLFLTYTSVAIFVRRNLPVMAFAALACALVMAFHQIVDTIWIYPKVGTMWWLILAFGAAAVDGHGDRKDRAPAFGIDHLHG